MTDLRRFDSRTFEVYDCETGAFEEVQFSLLDALRVESRLEPSPVAEKAQDEWVERMAAVLATVDPLLGERFRRHAHRDELIAILDELEERVRTLDDNDTAIAALRSVKALLRGP
jgi:hypothetical protein